MNAVAEDVVTDYFIDGMSNAEYHAMKERLSASTAKDVLKDPALLEWSKAAPQDQSKMSAIDFGTDFHSYFLEPDAFAETYKVLPEFNRRTKEGKADEQTLIKRWESDGIIPVTHEDMSKLKAMRDSAMAHPTVAAIMKLKWIAERSYFWTDKMTGAECKCRPDLLALDVTPETKPFAEMPDNCSTLVMDVKTIAQFGKIQSQIEELKYYVQDAFYTRGIERVTNTKVCFVFAFVSTSLSLGRYPVQVVMLEDTAKFDGKTEVGEALATFARLTASKKESSWQTVVKLDRPHWATRDDDIL